MTPHRSLAFVSAFAASLTLGGNAFSSPFTYGNILVAHHETLFEYTLDGKLVQSLEVPRPEGYPHVVWGVVQDSRGRVHLNVNSYTTSPFDFISTYDPWLDQWSHAPVLPANRGFGDLSIWGDYLFQSSGVRVDLRSMTSTIVNAGLYPGPGVFRMGKDGILYGVHSGTPQRSFQRTDPVTLQNIGPQVDIMPTYGLSLTVARLAVREDGEILVSGWNGYIARCTALGFCFDSIDTGPNNFRDIEVNESGVIVAANRVGDLVVTDVEFSAFHSFNVGRSITNTFVSFVTYQVPEPSAAVLLLSAASVILLWKSRRRHDTQSVGKAHRSSSPHSEVMP